MNQELREIQNTKKQRTNGQSKEAQQPRSKERNLDKKRDTNTILRPFTALCEK